MRYTLKDLHFELQILGRNGKNYVERLLYKLRYKFQCFDAPHPLLTLVLCVAVFATLFAIGTVALIHYGLPSPNFDYDFLCAGMTIGLIAMLFGGYIHIYGKRTPENGPVTEYEAYWSPRTPEHM
jgi:hypothetical protein